MKDIKQKLPAFTYGSIDGIITTFSVVAASAGANLPINIILILGIANVLSDGFSMASSSYLSFRAQEDIQEKVLQYSPIEIALVTFISFVLLGITPLIAFIVGYLFKLPGKQMYIYSYILTFIALFWVGYKKGTILSHNPYQQGFQSLVVGGFAAIISYLVGYLLRGLT